MPQIPGRPLPPLPDPKSLDATNMLRPIMLIARPEHDGTFTLVLDAPGTETLPTELGGGYPSIDDIKTAVFLSLTAPAIEQDRMQVLEDAVGRVNQLIDAVNDLTNHVSSLIDRVSMLEQITGSGNRTVPIRSPIQRLGQRPGFYEPDPGRPPRPQPPRGQYHDLRNAWDEQQEQFEAPRQGQQGQPQQPLQPPLQPPRPPPRAAQPPQGPRPDVSEGPRPSFNRGEFVPHQPVGRVSRGPGTPDHQE